MENFKFWLVIIFFMSIFSCKKEIPFITPEIKSITESVYASGIVKSDRQYNIFSASSGVIKKVLVKVGDVVEKGSPIIIIQNQTAQFNAENASIYAQYNAYSKNDDKLAQIKQDIQFVRIKLSSDSLFLSRQNKLWSQGIGTKTELEQRELTYQNTKTNLESLKMKLRDTQRQLKFAEAQSKKNLQISQALLQDFTVRSEIPGRIYAISKEVGEFVGPTSQLGVIGDDKSFQIELQLDEYDIIKIKKSQEVVVKLDSYNNNVLRPLWIKLIL
ncbi:MAG: HlyD family efflux transporter periplasmic adaptor subunit [Saprospiraceae bacterium]|nr:HlyD family efflux transporter periplasmic adaptor subunit [Saprospiraceae bacterium]